jgi:hypothetical protein
MINKLLITIVIGLAVSGLGCQNGGTLSQGYLDREFTLEKGQQIHFNEEKLTVKFIDVSNDNRCTKVCVWEGNADVVVQVTDATGKKESLTLNTTNYQDYSTTKNFGQYKIQLIGLESSGCIFTSYQPTLTVTK